MFIFYTTNDLYHDNLSQHEVLWKKTCKHFGCWKNAPKVHQRIHIKWFSHGHAFIFMANLNIDCWIFMEAIEKTLGTHASMLFNYLEVAKGCFITFKCLQKLYSTLDCNQYCGYTTPKLSIMPWVGHLPCNFNVTRQSITLTTHIHFLLHFNAN